MVFVKQQTRLDFIANRLFRNEKGCLLISGLFGIALALMLKRVCKGKGCIVIQAPPLNEINNTIYELEGECYKYTPKVVKCSDATPASAPVHSTSPAKTI